MDSDEENGYDLNPNFEHIVFEDTSYAADLSGEAIFTSGEIKQRLTDAIDKYKANVEGAMDCEINSKIMAYLRLIPHSWPFKIIVVGQSPYKDAILPTYGSAFAFDSSFCPGFTPSVQVLSQFVASEDKSRTQSIASLLSVSYILVADEILMINAMPCVTDNSVLNMRVSSFTSELIRELTLCNHAAGIRGLSLVRFGGAAKACVEHALDSVSAKIRAEVQIESTDFEHPASIARKYAVWTGGRIYEPSTQCQDINFELKTGRKDLSVKRSYDMYGHHKWHRYLDFQINEVGKLTKAQKFIKTLNDINVELTWKAFQQILNASMSSSSGPSKFVKREHGDGGENQLTYVDKLLNFSWNMANDTRVGWEEDRVRFQEAIEKYNATGVDRDYDRMMEMCFKIMQSISRVAQSLRSVHANVISSQSAIPSSQGKVTPIARLGINVTVDDTKATLKKHAKLRAKAQTMAQDGGSSSVPVVVVEEPTTATVVPVAAAKIVPKATIKGKGKAPVRNANVVAAPIVVVAPVATETKVATKPASLEEMKKRVMKQKIVSTSSSVNNNVAPSGTLEPKMKVKKMVQPAPIVTIQAAAPTTIASGSTASVNVAPKKLKKKVSVTRGNAPPISTSAASSVSAPRSENMHGMLNMQIAPGNLKSLKTLAKLMNAKKSG